MPAPPKPTEIPDLPPQTSAVGLPDGARRYGSTGQLSESRPSSRCALFYFGALCRGLLSRHPALIEAHLPGTWTTY
jgi:hypothetical protein